MPIPSFQQTGPHNGFSPGFQAIKKPAVVPTATGAMGGKRTSISHLLDAAANAHIARTWRDPEEERIAARMAGSAVLSLTAHGTGTAGYDSEDEEFLLLLLAS